MTPALLSEVELHSIEAGPKEATKASLVRLGIPLFEFDGKYFIPEGFSTIAANSQGIIKRIIRHNVVITDLMSIES